jgi:DNA-binding transcriptional regulator YiaG
MSTQERRQTIDIPVPIPNLDGDGILFTKTVKVEAVFDPEVGDYLLDGAALRKIETAKARYMGLLSPASIRELRESLGLTQKQICELLQIGEKTYTRWESGRDHPSRSLNLLLKALRDGRIDIAYLCANQPEGADGFTVIQPVEARPYTFPMETFDNAIVGVAA